MKQQIAIIGPTASGKSALAVEVAKKLDGVILSLDSLAVYKGGDIASAKPPLNERGGIAHFGFDLVEMDENFNAALFFKEYEKAVATNKPLIIVGGTSFYLKSLIGGLSELPFVNDDIKNRAAARASEPDAYLFLKSIDEQWSATDRYRIARGLEIYYTTNKAPSAALQEAKKEPVCKNAAIYEISVDRDILRERIRERTEQMFSLGLIKEVQDIAAKYGEDIKYCKAIGPKEVLAFLRGDISEHDAKELIITHTAQLAKRQRTFNRTQFAPHTCGSVGEILDIIATLESDA